jgi:hypothetical protein
MLADIQILFLRDGRYDVADGTTGRAARRAQRMGAFVGDEAKRTADMFLSKGAQKLADPTKSPFLRQSVATNLNPRGLTRLGSMSQLTGQQATGFYTPFQGVPRAMNYIAKKSAGVRNAFGIAEGDNAYSGGVLGRMMSMNRINNAESLIAKAGGIQAVEGGAGGKRAQRALKQRNLVVENIQRVQNLANPSAPTIAGSTQGRSFTAAKIREARAAAQAAEAVPALSGKGTIVAQGERYRNTATGRFVSAKDAEAARAAHIRSSVRGARAQAQTTITANAAAVADDPLRAVSSTMTTGKISNAITSYYAGAINPELMTKAQRVLTKRVTRQIAGSAAGGRAGFASFMDDFGKTGRYAGNAARQMMGGGKMIGMAGQYLRSGGSKAVAAKFAGMGALKTVGAALPGLNVLATASLIYDVTKGIGKIAVAGQNFAKDAVKSMQGSINKPIFGAGFVDNEVSASSRARGVMAIQNSRLNARSLLGSEAAMMAAHFG